MHCIHEVNQKFQKLGNDVSKVKLDVDLSGMVRFKSFYHCKAPYFRLLEKLFGKKLIELSNHHISCTMTTLKQNQATSLLRETGIFLWCILPLMLCRASILILNHCKLSDDPWTCPMKEWLKQENWYRIIYSYVK